jgi:hypothetical protein
MQIQQRRIVTWSGNTALLAFLRKWYSIAVLARSYWLFSSFIASASPPLSGWQLMLFLFQRLLTSFNAAFDDVHSRISTLFTPNAISMRAVNMAPLPGAAYERNGQEACPFLAGASTLAGLACVVGA